MKRLKSLIIREKLKQKDLANNVGITEAALSKYLKGERTPQGETLCNLATALNTTVDYLLGLDNEELFNDNLNFDNIERILARKAKNYSLEQKQELIRIILGERR